MSPNPDPSPEDDPVLRETLKRCSPATYYAACKFRQSGRREDLNLVILGVIERYLERGLRPQLANPNPALRLAEDLGIDSLTMMEIVMIAEDVLRISVSNEELTHLRTLGDVESFIAAKVSRPPSPVSASKSPTETEVWDVAAVGLELRQSERVDATLGASVDRSGPSAERKPEAR